MSWTWNFSCGLAWRVLLIMSCRYQLRWIEHIVHTIYDHLQIKIFYGKPNSERWKMRSCWLEKAIQRTWKPPWRIVEAILRIGGTLLLLLCLTVLGLCWYRKYWWSKKHASSMKTCPKTCSMYRKKLFSVWWSAVFSCPYCSRCFQAQIVLFSNPQKHSRTDKW